MNPVSTKDLQLYEKDEVIGEIMPLTKHLDELRTKIIFSVISLVISTTIGFYLSRDIIKLLTDIAPKDTSFFQIKPGEFFFSSVKVSFYCGILLSSPIILWQLASFIFPGLKPEEKKLTIPILIGSPFLFLCGSLFAYNFIAPSMLNFLFGFGENIISTSISIENYISFTLMIMAMCGCTFLLPAIIFTLAGLKIIDSNFLISQWRYAILTSVVLGAILTPTPDPFNMGIISGILIGLYFISSFALKIIKI